MISQKIITFARRLFQMTQEGKLRWEETGREGVYQLAIEEYIVRVSELPGAGPEQPSRYQLVICNAKGSILEEVGNEDLSDRMFESDEFLRDLYQRARRVAMGVDAALDRIIAALGPEKKS